MTLVFVVSTWALFANAQTSTNATVNPNPAAPNVQVNPPAQAIKVQPGVNPGTPAVNPRQPIRTSRIQEERNAVRQPSLRTQPAPTNVPAQAGTGIVDPSIQNAPLGTQYRGLLQSQTQLRERMALGPQVLRGPDVGLWFNPTIRDGLVIADVMTTGPFARLGFVEGDRIVSVNGRPVLTEPDFMQLLTANNAEPVEGGLFRNARNQRIVVDPAILSQDNLVAEVSPLEEFGIVLDDRFNDRVVVWQVLPQSPAFYAGFRPGDVVTTLGGQPFRTRAEFETAVSGMRAGQANVQVRRGDRARNLVVDVPQFTRTAQRSAVRQRLGDRIEGRTQGIDQGGNNPGINQRQNNLAVPDLRGGAGERGENR